MQTPRPASQASSLADLKLNSEIKSVGQNVDLNQGLIQKKLAAFLLLQTDEKLSPAEEKAREFFIKALSDDLNKIGFCFGFSLCRAAMSVAGKRIWWQNALFAIASWDGDKEKLKTPIVLPNSDSNEPVELREIFKKVLNYIIGNFGQRLASYKDFHLRGMNQENILDEKLQLFEVLKGKEVLKVQQHVKVAGNFTTEQLKALIRESDVEENIVLFHCADHTIQFNLAGGRFEVYDSLREDKNLETFESKEDAIKEVMRLMQIEGFERKGEVALAYEIATLKKGAEKLALPMYEEMMEKNPVDLLKGFGLIILAKECPNDLSRILNNAKKSNHPDLPDIIGEALWVKDETYDCTGIHIIASYTPHVFADLLDIAEKSEKAKEKIFLALISKSQDGLTGLDMIEKHIPACASRARMLMDEFVRENVLKIPSVFQYVVESKGGENVIAEALAQDVKGKTGVAIANENGLLEKALAQAKRSATWPDGAASLLTSRNSTGTSALQRLLYSSDFSTEPLMQTLRAAAESKLGARQILLALASENKAGDTGRTVLKTTKPVVQQAVMAEFVRSLKKLSDDELQRLAEDVKSSKEAKSKFRGLRKKNPENLNNLFRSYADNALLKQIVKDINFEIVARSITKPAPVSEEKVTKLKGS
jgi:hypothetical protein